MHINQYPIKINIMMNLGHNKLGYKAKKLKIISKHIIQQIIHCCKKVGCKFSF